MWLLIIFGIAILVLGIIQIKNPSFGWKYNEGWKVNGDSEPSDAYLIMAEIGGIFATVLGAVFILLGALKVFL
ncbi:DUF6199 family natural product biosynthesis protein [Paenibacillus azoreducens]|uniref:DUF6199 domain-containing protein n=1 Tax=Paenibacillus azoreducens TaxID=116718 RepID=A0A920CPT5_9BACL|nr:DUF6199 family natural product biosynthesis protein [Paenibacillus azoreducens]GIO46645.1 hypothetical protein J34TS1_14100 [Paenibacillus azoreducens]